MEIILISKAMRGGRRVHLGRWATGAIGVVLVAACAGAYYLGQRSSPVSADPRPELFAAALEAEMLRQRGRVDEAIHDAERNLDALALQLGEMQARIIRLDALGSRLVEMAKLDAEEFNFNEPPARGGPLPSEELARLEVPDFLDSLKSLSLKLEDREPMLSVVEGTLMNRKLQAEVYPAGRPVKKGWLSSFFGYRNDPITGQRDFHAGIDFAGRNASDVVAVAAGVVVWSGRRWKYGLTVEVNHGNGYSTLYAHNSKNLVKVGDTVKKGQVLALMGSTGRSTGPHVHFEVRYNGKAVNPIKFVRASR